MRDKKVKGYAKSNGCPWTGPLSTENVHYIACEYRDEQYPNYGSYMMWTKLKKHTEFECPMRLIICRSESILVSHEKVCNKIICDYGFQRHIRKKCPGIELPCSNNCNPNCVLK